MWWQCRGEECAADVVFMSIDGVVKKRSFAVVGDEGGDIYLLFKLVKSNLEMCNNKKTYNFSIFDGNDDHMLKIHFKR